MIRQPHAPRTGRERLDRCAVYCLNMKQSFNVGRMEIRDGPAKGTFRLIFNEAEFPQALANLNATYTA